MAFIGRDYNRKIAGKLQYSQRANLIDVLVNCLSLRFFKARSVVTLFWKLLFFLLCMRTWNMTVLFNLSTAVYPLAYVKEVYVASLFQHERKGKCNNLCCFTFTNFLLAWHLLLHILMIVPALEFNRIVVLCFEHETMVCTGIWMFLAQWLNNVVSVRTKDGWSISVN